MSQIDNRIVIIGGGPVGMALAYRLHEFRIPALLLDRNLTRPEDLRASTFHPPTLDLLDAYGLAQPLIDQGLKAPHWQIRVHETHESAVFDLDLIKDKTSHPYRLQCEQFRLCTLLAERLADSPYVEIRPGALVEAVSQDDDGVTVRGTMTDGAAFEEKGRLLVGADGAHSIVRQSMNLSFEGVTYPETTVLATTTFPFEEHLPGLSNVSYIWRDGGTFSLLRLQSKWRCSLYPEEGKSIEQATEPAVIERKLQSIVARDEPYEVIDLRPYRVHMRIVDDYRHGRFILAGDAAHVNSPSGGMGMNGGVHDAFNLSAVIRDIWNGADLSLLDRYTRQRLPIARDEILAQADTNRARMQERNWDRRREMFAKLQATANDPVAARAHLLKSSMILGLERSAGID
jgi:3-(3-hydroxy-phenyl)propionate hydroxylase